MHGLCQYHERWLREEVTRQQGVADDVSEALRHENGFLGCLLKIACRVEDDDRGAAALDDALERLDVRIEVRSEPNGRTIRQQTP